MINKPPAPLAPPRPARAAHHVSPIVVPTVNMERGLLFRQVGNEEEKERELLGLHALVVQRRLDEDRVRVTTYASLLESAVGEHALDSERIVLDRTMVRMLRGSQHQPSPQV
jgi:hypothetical protein